MYIQYQILMKTYQNDTIYLTRMIIIRKRPPILILDSIENSHQLQF